MAATPDMPSTPPTSLARSRAAGDGGPRTGHRSGRGCPTRFSWVGHPTEALPHPQAEA